MERSMRKLNDNYGDNECCLCQRLEIDLKVKCPPELFFKFNVKTPYLYVQAYPARFQGVKLLEGEYGKEGCVVMFKFLDGQFSIACLISVDYEENCAVWEEVDGHLADAYKRFQITLYCFPKCEGSRVKWIFNYEKKDHYDQETTQLYNNTIIKTQAVDKYCFNGKP